MTDLSEYEKNRILKYFNYFNLNDRISKIDLFKLFKFIGIPLTDYHLIHSLSPDTCAGGLFTFEEILKIYSKNKILIEQKNLEESISLFLGKDEKINFTKFYFLLENLKIEKLNEKLILKLFKQKSEFELNEFSNLLLKSIL